MSVSHLLKDLDIASRVPIAVKVVMFLSYTALVAALVGVAEHKISKELAKEPIPWVVGLVALCTLSVSILVLQLSERIQDLHLMQRMRFKYYPSGGSSDPSLSERMYDAARRVITAAREDGTCEVIAVNSFHESFDPLEDKGAHRRYFEALNLKLGKVHYHRLVQCATREQLAANVSDEYREHFNRVIELRDDPKYAERRIQLDMVAPVFPTAFIIVRHADGPTDLIWQLNEYTDKTHDGSHVFRVRGLLHVIDPDRRLVRYFEGWFNRLLNDETYRIKRSDLQSSK